MAYNPHMDPKLLDATDEVARRYAPLGYLHFLPFVTVNCQPDPQPFGQVAEPWQWAREEARAGALDQIAGIARDYRGPRRFWSGCAKGNDKSTGVARRVMFLLAYSRRPVQVVITAGSEDQAALITTAAQVELGLNPWLQDRVTVTDLGGTGASKSELHVLPMKAATGQGIFPDYLIADEVTHWEHDEGRKFWDFVIASVNKRPMCVFEVLTNAGFVGSWQWEARNAFARSPRWHFFEQPAHTRLATWMDAAAIAEDGAAMTDGERRRLHGNEWIDPGEERGVVSLAEAEACVDPDLEERTHGKPGEMYYAVIDYGSGNKQRNRDRTVLAVMHPVPGSDHMVIDRMDCWEDSAGGRVLIDTPVGDPFGQRSVEGWIELTRRNFFLQALVLDPYQLESLAQKYERRGIRVIRYEYEAGKKNYRMLRLIQTMIRNKRIAWSPEAGLLPGASDDTLAKELSRLVVKPTIYGFRADHESGGHNDRSATIGMGMTTIVEEMVPGGRLGPQSVKPKEEKSDARGLQATIGLPVQKDWMKLRGLYGVR